MTPVWQKNTGHQGVRMELLMSITESSFFRKTDEGISQFDDRISHMLPVVAGVVYFDIRNYNSGTGAFHVWMEWDAALNNRLNDRLPSGGYFIKATEKQAQELWEQTEGLPVYMKLIAREGRIYPYRTYMMWKGRPFSVEFDGKALLPPEQKTVVPECSDKKQMAVVGAQGSQQILKLDNQGSQRGFLNLGGSQRNWQYEWENETGSNRGFLNLGGSQRNFQYEWEYETGSNRSFLNLGGSQRNFQYEWEYEIGSQRGFLNLGGSQRNWQYEWEYEIGSQRGFLNLGGSQRSACGYEVDYQEIPRWTYLPPEWQLIQKSKRPCSKKGGNSDFGYGLDLI